MYACITCVPEAKTNPEKRAGICLACSYKCHDRHEFIELYTKRNFRCDCGTSKILAIRCKLDAEKLDDNDNNKYNQNFSGTYCLCKRPYPDPEDDIDDQMIQCILCEDWYHSRHLETETPDTSTFEEMICSTCTKKHEFLNNYSHLSVAPKDDNLDESVTESIDADASVENKDQIDRPDTGKKEEILDDELNQCIRDIIEINKTNNQPESVYSNEDDGPPKKKIKTDVPCTSLDEVAGGSGSCRRPKTVLNQFTGASFWPSNWRSSLCQCSECLSLYKQSGIEYLIDVEDTVLFYQEKGKARGSSSMHDDGMRALSNMDHVTQIEAITGYNKLKNKLKDFLTTFVANKQIVTENDVNVFFQSMSKDKKKEF